MPDYFSKKARRAQEKVLQKLGKADETRDESFDEHVNNFNKQQAEVHKLHKEFKQYLSSMKDMKTAASNLNEAISEVYDGEWGGYSELYSVLEDSKAIWASLAQRLSEEVVSPFAIYQSQFPEFKSRIAKRGRKLIDYDACRHNLDSVKQKGKADDRKLSQLEEEEMVAKKIYEELNSQLSNELPAIYDSRVAFYVSTLHSYYSTEMEFSRKMLKVQEQLCDLINKVVDGRSTSSSSRSSPNINSERLSADSVSTTSAEKSPARERKKRQAPKVVKKQEKPANPFGDPDKEGDDAGKGNPFGEEKSDGKGNPFGEDEDEGKGNPFGEDEDDKKGNPFGDDDDEEEEKEAPGNPFGGEDEDEEKEENDDDKSTGNPFGNDDDNNDESKDKDDGNPFGNADDNDDEKDSSKKSQDEPKPASVKSARVSKASKKPDKVLYQVRAKNNYVGNGSDILSLIKGDYINVIGFDNDRTDKENEEWLIGIRRSDFVKGSFPASAVAKDTTL